MQYGSILRSMKCSGCGGMMYGIFSWYTLGPTVPTESNPSILQCKVHTAASSRIVHHAVKLRSFQTDSTVLSFFTLLFMEAMPFGPG